MRKFQVLTLAATAALACGAASAAAPSLQIRDAAVRVVVIPEARADVKVDVLKTNPNLPLYIEKLGDMVIVDGHLPKWFSGCRGHGEDTHYVAMGKGDFAAADWPTIIVHTPMDVHVDAGGATIGTVDRAHSVSLNHGGCGDWKVANVEGELEARLSGVGDIETGTSGSAHLTLSGAGNLRAGAVRSDLTARVSGVGSIVTTTSATADMDVSGAGSVHSRSVAGGLHTSISGTGSVNVERIDGPLNAHISGTGSLYVPNGDVTAMEAHVSGTGGVRFGGTAQTLDAHVSGVGSVVVAKVVGNVNKSVSGVGSVRVGQ